MSEISKINVKDIPADRVGFGSSVRVLNLVTHEETTFKIVAGDYIDLDAGHISLESPIGRGLLGARQGDRRERPPARRREAFPNRGASDAAAAAGRAGIADQVSPGIRNLVSPPPVPHPGVELVTTKNPGGFAIRATITEISGPTVTRNTARAPASIASKSRTRTPFEVTRPLNRCSSPSTAAGTDDRSSSPVNVLGHG